METPQGTDWQSWAFRAALAGAGLVGALLVLIASAPQGLWVSPDSMVYADVARHIAAGAGIQATNIHGQPEFVLTWPPLYPLLMSPFVALGAEPGDVGRWLNALANGLLAILTGLCARRITSLRAAGGAAAWLSAVASSFLLNAATFWSEAVFLAIVAGALLCLLRWSAQRRWPWLVAGGALIGLACLQRYAGYAFVAAGAVWVLQLRGAWRERLKNAGIFMAAAAPLPVLWRICVLVFAGQVDARAVGFAWPDSEHFVAVGYAVAAWLFPVGWPTLVRAGLAVLTVGAIVGGIGFTAWHRLRRMHDHRLEPAAPLLAIFALAYAGLVATTILFFDHPLHANERILSPLLPLLLIALVWLAFAQTGRRRVAACMLLAMIGLGYAVRDIDVISQVRQGQAWSEPRWTDSPLIAGVEQLPADAPIASNWREVIMYYTGRPVADVPMGSGSEILRPPGTVPFPDPPAARALLLNRLKHERGYIAWFWTEGHTELPPELAGFRVVAGYSDGVILAVD